MLFNPPGGSFFGNTQSSHGTTRPVSGNYGATVTPAIGSFGGWAQLISSTTYDSYGILINANSVGVNTASINAVINIGIDPAGGSSYTVVIPYLIVGQVSTYGALGGGGWYYFPLFIPKGASVAVQSQSTVTTAFRVLCHLHQAPVGPVCARRANFVQAIGISGNVGTTLTGGTTNEGSWTSLGTTTRDLWYFQMGMQVVSSDTGFVALSAHFDLGYGDGTNFRTILADQYYQQTSAEIASWNTVSVGCEYFVPSGSTLYMRMWSSGTPDSMRVAAYGAGG